MIEKKNYCLLGAITGDVIGSVYEFNAPKTTEFELFTPGSQGWTSADELP